MKNDAVRKYFDLKNEECFQRIEDTTATDLNIDELFHILGFTDTPIGQQYLYNTLRCIPIGNSIVSQNEKWISFFSKSTELYKKLYKILKKLNNNDSYSIYSLITTVYKPFSKKSVVVFYILQFIPAIFLLTLVFTKSTVAICGLFIFFLINLAIHYKTKAKLFSYSGSIPMLKQLIYTCRKLKNSKEFNCDLLNKDEIDQALSSTKKIYRELSNYRFLAKLDSDITMIAWLISELLRIFFLSEVINLNTIFKLIEKNRKELIYIFEYVGLIDTLSSVVKMRTDVPYYSIPVFTNESYELEFQDIYHPLIINCVSNSLLLTNSSYLVLGSNMSGKTSFIRTVGVNMIMAQTLNTCFAKHMTLCKQKIHSVIAVNDNLTMGHSYYLSEVLRIKDVINTTTEGSNLILLDELFKGTNTRERIAAATAVLKYLLKNKFNRVLVATHDMELIHLLSEIFSTIFFEEKIEESELLFDYKIAFEHSGSMNAIRILELYQFPKAIVHEALNMK